MEDADLRNLKQSALSHLHKAEELIALKQDSFFEIQLAAVCISRYFELRDARNAAT